MGQVHTIEWHVSRVRRLQRVSHYLLVVELHTESMSISSSITHSIKSPFIRAEETAARLE